MTFAWERSAKVNLRGTVGCRRLLILIVLLSALTVASLLIEVKSDSPPQDNAALTVADAKSLDVYYFYGEGCSSCAKVERFLSEIQDKYAISLHKFEIYGNRSNLSLFDLFSNNYKIFVEEKAIPAIFFSAYHFIGETQILENFEASLQIALQENEDSPTQMVNTEDSILEPSNSSMQISISIVAITFAALVDAFSPCSIAVLVFLIGARVLMKGQNKRALKVGLSFCLSFFIAYFLFGLGLLSAIQVSGLSGISSLLVGIVAIAAGILYIKDVFWYGRGGFTLDVPRSLQPKLMGILKKVTNPVGAFLVGFVVASFELPCTGGPYLFILGHLANSSTRLQAIPMLLYYNLIFVMPLVVISLLLYSKLFSMAKMREWSSKTKRLLKFAGGLVLVVLGLVTIPTSQLSNFVLSLLQVIRSISLPLLGVVMVLTLFYITKNSLSLKVQTSKKRFATSLFVIFFLIPLLVSNVHEIPLTPSTSEPPIENQAATQLLESENSPYESTRPRSLATASALEFPIYETAGSESFVDDGMLDQLEEIGYGNTLPLVIKEILNSNRYVFLYFYAEWCGYCNLQRDILNEIEPYYSDKIVFLRIDQAKNPLALTEWSIKSFPTMFLVYNYGSSGFAYQTFEGYTEKSKLEFNLQNLLEGIAPTSNSSEYLAESFDEGCLGDSLPFIIDDSLASDHYVFLYFYAEWCGYSALQSPIINELELVFSDQITFVRIEESKNPDAVAKWYIQGFPTIFVITSKNSSGYQYYVFNGYKDKDFLEINLNHILNGEPVANDKDYLQTGHTCDVQLCTKTCTQDFLDKLIDIRTLFTCANWCEENGIEDPLLYYDHDVVLDFCLERAPSDLFLEENLVSEEEVGLIESGCLMECNQAPAFWSEKYGHDCRSGGWVQALDENEQVSCINRIGVLQLGTAQYPSYYSWPKCSNCEWVDDLFFRCPPEYPMCDLIFTAKYHLTPSGKNCTLFSCWEPICRQVDDDQSCDDDDDCTIDTGDPSTGCFHTRIPGCDSPDENYAVSPLNLETDIVLGSNTSRLPMQRIGILMNGFAPIFENLITELGHSVYPIPVYLEEIADQEFVDLIPVLLISSGGLSGLDSSSVKNRLEDYVENGGTLIVFAQQHGYEYQALPGGELSGYGWFEDQSCQLSSAAISTYHPIFAGQPSTVLDVNVDGFFTSYPENTTVLLSRTKNGMPVMVTYNYGKGRVVASTLYSDMAQALYQFARGDKILIRDLLTWAGNGKLVETFAQEQISLPINVTNPYDFPSYSFSAGDLVTIPVNVTNRGNSTSDKVTFILYDPFYDFSTRVITELSGTLEQNESRVIDFTYQTSISNESGVWSIAYFFFSGNESVWAAWGPEFSLDYGIGDLSELKVEIKLFDPDAILVKSENVTLVVPPESFENLNVTFVPGKLGLYTLEYSVQTNS
ncbi:hypothetical protein E2P60_04785, partial [Candidatus Bathyarchaeota archaeon]